MALQHRVIYIMGTARSGSTILEILLAEAENVFGAGEITNLIEDGFIEDKPCSCQQSSSRCSIWGPVKDRLGLSESELKEFECLLQKVDWHTGFIQQLFGLMSKKDLLAYQKFNQALLLAIERTSGCQIILDSSKFSGRAIALKRFLKGNLSVICLTRSPIGLMKSFQKPNKDEQRPKSPLVTLIYYLVTLTSLRLACWILGKNVMQMRYEELQANPVDSLKSIEAFCGLDLKQTKQQIKKRESFDVGHIVTGNRLRKKGRVYFQQSEKNQSLKDSSHPFFVGIMQIWKWGLRF